MAKMPVVDHRERERIRHALKRYMQLNENIGAPDLRQRMLHTLERDYTYIPLKRLQRFLADTHRTEDIMVLRYARFLESVAPPPAEDELGAAMASFFPALPDREDWFQSFPGTYRTHIRTFEPKPDQNIRGSDGQVLAVMGQVTAKHSSQPPAFKIPWSVLRLEQGDNLGFLRATETVFDPEVQASDQQAPPKKSWLGNTGIFVPFSSTEYLTMVRSFLHTRVYILSTATDSPHTLRGIAFQSQGMLNISTAFLAEPRQPAFEIQITRE